MRNLFDETFFKYASLFLVVLLASFIVILAAERFSPHQSGITDCITSTGETC